MKKHKEFGLNRLERLELRKPEKAKKIKARLKKLKEDREDQEPADDSPDMTWNKAALIEYAESLDPPIDVPTNWTKQTILDAIEEHEPA